MTTDTDIAITLTVYVPIRLVADAISTAFEAGSYGSLYWLPRADRPPNFRITAAERAEHCNWYTTPRTWTPGHGHVVTFHELVDESSHKTEPHAFDVDRMQEHLARVAKSDPVLFAAFLNSDDDPLDGPAADTFVQLLVLGEVRYG